jgi:hypothetical protein
VVARRHGRLQETFGVMPGRWLQLEAQYDTLGACQRILTPAPESSWAPVLGHLWEADRLHWSAEAVRPHAEVQGTLHGGRTRDPAGPVGAIQHQGMKERRSLMVTRRVNGE